MFFLVPFSLKKQQPCFVKQYIRVFHKSGWDKKRGAEVRRPAKVMKKLLRVHHVFLRELPGVFIEVICMVADTNLPL